MSRFRSLLVGLIGLFVGLVCFPLYTYATVTSVGGSVSLSAGFSEAVTGLPGYNATSNVSYLYQYGAGTGTGNYDLASYVVASGSLAGGASTTLDLTSFNNREGTAVTTMTKLKFLWIENTGTQAIDVGNAAANQFIGTGFLKGATDVFTLAAGQVMVVSVPVGITVSAGAKMIKLLNTSGGTATSYKVLGIGSSA